MLLSRLYNETFSFYSREEKKHHFAQFLSMSAVSFLVILTDTSLVLICLFIDFPFVLIQQNL